MIKAIINGVINLIMSLVGIITSPIDLIISQSLPDLGTSINSLNIVFNRISDVIGWCIDLTGLSSTAIQLIITYYTFKLTVPILFSSIKAAIKWYDKLKL